MLIKIPHFKDVIVCAFECPHCGYSNNDLQPATTVAEKGVSYTLQIKDDLDLNRQLVKNEFASVRLEELDLELPVKSGKPVLTTIEGFLGGIIEDLSIGQEHRTKVHPSI